MKLLSAAEDLPFVSLDADDEFDDSVVVDINSWLRSDRDFILFHRYQITLPMTAGAWGSRNRAVPNMHELVERYSDHWFGLDECFLLNVIWPIVQQKGYWVTPRMTKVYGFIILGLLTLVRSHFRSNQASIVFSISRRS